MSHVNRNAATVHRQSGQRVLSWQEALAILQTCDERGVPTPFAIAFSTADESMGTGGEIIRYERAVWHVKGGRVQQSDTHERIGSKPARESSNTRWVRKIRGIDTDQIRNVFVHLILEINGQPVR